MYLFKINRDGRRVYRHLRKKQCLGFLKQLKVVKSKIRKKRTRKRINNSEILTYLFTRTDHCGDSTKIKQRKMPETPNIREFKVDHKISITHWKLQLGA